MSFWSKPVGGDTPFSALEAVHQASSLHDRLLQDMVSIQCLQLSPPTIQLYDSVLSAVSFVLTVEKGWWEFRPLPPI